MADIITLDTSDFTIATMFRAGYRDGRDSVDEMSREAAHKRGLEDARANRDRTAADIGWTENVAYNPAVASTEEGAYAFGWDAGWQDEVQDAYRRGYAEGLFKIAAGQP